MDKLVITERPLKWNKTQYTVVTLNDLTGESLDKLINEKFSFIIVDETVKNEDILLFQKESEYQFITDIIIPLLKEYSICIVPQLLTSIRNRELVYQGVFRFENHIFYDIFSKNPTIDLNDFFTDRSGIILVKNAQEEIETPPIIQNKILQITPTPAETVIVIIRKIVDYNEFESNMKIFNDKVGNKLVSKTEDINDLLNDVDIKKSNYITKLLSDVKDKYKTSRFPKQLRFYFVVVLHNQLLRDPKFEKSAKYISDNIDDTINGNRHTKFKGIVIQSVSFLPIKGYDPVELFKIKNDDNYYIWMKTENPNGPKKYELRIRDLDYIRENLSNLNRIHTGGKKKPTKPTKPTRTTRKKYKYERYPRVGFYKSF